MNNITFTLEQVQQIINTLLVLSARESFDTLYMIKTIVDNQQKEKIDTRNGGTKESNQHLDN